MFGRQSIAAAIPALTAETNAALKGTADTALPPKDEAPSAAPPTTEIPSVEEETSKALDGITSGSHISPVFPVKALAINESAAKQGEPLKLGSYIFTAAPGRVEIRTVLSSDQAVKEAQGDCITYKDGDMLVIVLRLAPVAAPEDAPSK